MANEKMSDLMDIVRRNLRSAHFPTNEVDRVIEAFSHVDRKEFTGISMEEHAYTDVALPIGFGQTCSQPSVVALMALLLHLGPGMRVLEIGLGCGYSAALTKHLIGKDGRMTSIELIPELFEIGKENLRMHFGDDVLHKGVRTICDDGSEGYMKEAPYDRIYLTAGVGAGFDPKLLASQLSLGGMLLYPEQNGALVLWKDPAGKSIERFEGFAFVPLRGKNS